MLGILNEKNVLFEIPNFRTNYLIFFYEKAVKQHILTHDRRSEMMFVKRCFYVDADFS